MAEPTPLRASRVELVRRAVAELLDEEERFIDAARHPRELTITLYVGRGGAFSIDDKRLTVQTARR